MNNPSPATPRNFDPADTLIPQLRGLRTSIIRSFDTEVSAIPGILKLTLGEPDFNTPDFIKQAAIDSLHRNRTHYATNAGTPELREAISAYLLRRRGQRYPAEDIIVTEGASEAITSCLTGLLGDDAALLYPTPSFGLYGNMATLTGAMPVPIDTSGTDFKLTPDALERALRSVRGRDAVLVLNSPNNPTGVALSSDRLRALAEVIERYDVTVLSDEVYAEIFYGHGPAPSIADYIPERTIVVNSTSKNYAMTGWRLGFFAAPHALACQLAKIHQIHVSTAATFTMDAAQAAYEQGDAAIDSMVAEYRRRRDLLANGFTDLGYQIVQPDGAFFLYVRVPDGHEQDGGFGYARLLARKAKVAGVPGEAFSDSPSPYVRFSYAANPDTLNEALRRIRTFRHAD
ncbi:pyridoxal phosphate-dependent aminotransferase [Bifidobacterium biavatii]|uniref:Aminotransferase n=1 Tax=Bifidobacterium biavatii DSM 23969 TaxID=1437608 RepID=A0A087A0I0_9BIFI|nr:aminotransferase class I/II-fold pyridoxal phosphate-dependent enzyme [Bifidobacterium biavatii]KFI52280.1 aromatic amino acid aminotransferase [Bifidobacterium biavatii DSM 23969]